MTTPVACFLCTDAIILIAFWEALAHMGKREKQTVPYVNRKTETFQSLLWQLFQTCITIASPRIPSQHRIKGVQICIGEDHFHTI